MAMLSALTVVTVLQCTHPPNYYTEPLKYISFLFVTYISTKGNKKKSHFGCCVENGWLPGQDLRQRSQLAADVESK